MVNVMNIERINDVDINYTLYGNSNSSTIILLHGWGQNIDMMKPIGNSLDKDYQILILDLPGFGKSSEPSYPWTLYEYVNTIHELVERLNIKNPIVMGHSFGGKLAILYASKYETKKLVLFASPINHNTKISAKTKILKSIKKLPGMNKIGNFMKQYIGSNDYKKASPVMRQILVDHINTDIYSELSKITAPTLIIWGDSDMAVNPFVAYEIKDAIKDSGVVMYEGCTHYAYLERLGQTINVLYSFLGEKNE